MELKVELEFAPVEFADNIGMPMREGLRLVHNTLVGLNIRTK